MILKGEKGAEDREARAPREHRADEKEEREQVPRRPYPAPVGQLVPEIEDHREEGERGDEEIFEPRHDHDRFAEIADREDEEKPRNHRDRAVAEQRLHEEIDEKRVEPVQQEVEKKVAPGLESETVEQEIRHAVDERLELVRLLVVEEGGLRLRHVEVVREIAEIVGVPEAVVEGDLEIEEAERKKHYEQ